MRWNEVAYIIYKCFEFSDHARVCIATLVRVNTCTSLVYMNLEPHKCPMLKNVKCVLYITIFHVLGGCNPISALQFTGLAAKNRITKYFPKNIRKVSSMLMRSVLSVKKSHSK